MNCNRKGTHEFAGVVVCADCHGRATNLLQDGETQLRKALVLLKEAIRVSLVEQTLAYDPKHPPVADILKNVILMTEAAERRKKNGR